MVVTGSWERTGSCAGLTPTKRKTAAKERGKKRCHIWAHWAGRETSSVWRASYFPCVTKFVLIFSQNKQKHPQGLKREWRNSSTFASVGAGLCLPAAYQQIWMGCSGKLIVFLVKPRAWFWLLTINDPVTGLALECSRGWGGNGALSLLLHHSAFFSGRYSAFSGGSCNTLPLYRSPDGERLTPRSREPVRPTAPAQEISMGRAKFRCALTALGCSEQQNPSIYANRRNPRLLSYGT